MKREVAYQGVRFFRGECPIHETGRQVTYVVYTVYLCEVRMQKVTFAPKSVFARFLRYSAKYGFDYPDAEMQSGFYFG